MEIYNTLTNKKEEFKTLNENVINMYVCGPTVNKRTHLGHLYPAIFFDTVSKYFRYKGYTVNYASNFTDVDDKIIASALEEGVSEKEIADRYATLYLEDLKKVNCTPVDYRPKVTEYMDDIINFISLLLEKGYAYQEGNDIYFSVDKVKNYGTLSNQKIENLDYGNRIEVDSNKKNPYDFVLWKKTENGIKWDSPFGEGRPGWHTECVVMINKIFNNKIDIHGGGIDLRFPHHENEMAQSEAAFNNSLASYWMHNGHLLMDGVKMSKSLGNVLSLDDILKEYNANTIRLAILKNHYRLPLNLSDNLFSESKTIDDKIKNSLKQANLLLQINNINTNNILKDETFEKYMDDDFNTSNVITYLLDLVKTLNIKLREKNNTEVSQLFDRILIITNVLGLNYNLITLTEEDKEIYNNWNISKENKDFEKADYYRNLLQEKNIL